jgi:hypothetical protein
MWMWQPVRAGVITHTDLPDFQSGLSDGIVQAVGETFSGSPPSGAIGVVPGVGASIFNDDMNYATVAAASANYLFLTPYQEEHAELAANPSQYLFSGDTPTAPSAAAPAAGILRMHVSRAQDFFNTGVVGQRSPMLLLNRTLLTGDWVAETKITIQQPRNTNESRYDALYVGIPTDSADGKANDLNFDDTSYYFEAGPGRAGEDQLVTRARLNPTVNGFPSNYGTGTFPGQTWYIRVVKRGAYFYSYMKNGETAAWVFHQMVKCPDLAAAPGLVVGVIAVSWGGVSTTSLQYQDDDIDYLRADRIGGLSGSFSNVFDAGGAADWQTISFAPTFRQGVKYQLRAGNALAGGTLTDGGDFAGPGGTAATYFVDDSAQVVPNAAGKRYLEYKFTLDGGTPPGGADTIDPKNLPATVRSVTATFEPTGVTAKTLSSAADFGADAGGVQTQTGGGDLSLTRTEIFRDDFAAATLNAGWTFDAGYTNFDPGVVGEYSLTDRPGYFRMKVGYPQDYYAGTVKLGGVKLLHDLPSSVNPNAFEVETEVNAENQQNRQAMLLLWQDETNYIGVSLGRRYENFWEVGIVEDILMNDNPLGPAVFGYGSNTLQLRVTKLGTTITMAIRDPNSNSPSWRTVQVRDTKGLGAGGTDFAPVKFGFMGKSYGFADAGTVNADYNYVRVANLAATGQKDIALTLPAGSKGDSLLLMGDALTTTNAKAQVRNAGGTFVGPDGTAASYFTVNEPKLPASLSPLTDTAIRIMLGDAAATPYVHALGLQFAGANAAVARDTNAADFAGGTVKNGVDVTSTPGLIFPTIGLGATLTEEFNSAPSGWLFSNTPPTTSSYSFTDNAGYARLYSSSPTDLWGPGTATDKPRVALFKNTPVTGDFEIETHVQYPGGRQVDRHAGLMVVQALPGGTPPDGMLDLTNVLMVGPYSADGMRVMRGDNNGFADYGPGGELGTDYYLRIRKIGRVFSGSYSADGTTWTFLDPYTFSHDMTSMYVGFLAKSYGASSGTEQIDYDFFKFSPLTTTGTFESHSLDLGASGLAAWADTLGGNSAAAMLQFRSADTAAGLAGVPYAGPDGTAATSYRGNYSGPLANVHGRYVQYKATLPAGTTLNDLAVIGVPSTGVIFSRADAVTALRIAGGLQAATSADVSRLDVVKGTSAGHIDAADATAILKAVAQ